MEADLYFYYLNPTHWGVYPLRPLEPRPWLELLIDSCLFKFSLIKNVIGLRRKRYRRPAKCVQRALLSHKVKARWTGLVMN